MKNKETGKVFSYTFALNINGIEEKKLQRLFKACYNAYRDTAMHYKKLLNNYYNDNAYKGYLSKRKEKALQYAIEKVGLEPSATENKESYNKALNAAMRFWFDNNKITSEEKEILQNLQKKYDLDAGKFGSSTIRKNILKQYKEYINDDIASFIVKSVASGVKQVLYSNGETIKIKPFNKYNSINLVRNRSKLIEQRDGGLFFHYKQHGRRGKVRIDEVEIITRNLPDEIQDAVSNGNIKYGIIKRLETVSGWKYQVQVLFEGVPTRTNLKKATGVVGVDVTEKHIAIVTENKTFYFKTPAKNEIITEKGNEIQRQMAVELRLTNPEHFNADGTFKKGVKGKLYKSAKFKKLKRKYLILCRKNNNYLEYQQNKLANEIVSLGNVINIVQKDWHEKVKRAEETTLTETGAFEDKSSLSEESVRQTAPAQLIEKIKQRAGYIGAEVNKVSNKELEIYCINIFTGEKMPYTIDDEFYTVNGTSIQRTIYYAYIMSEYEPNNKNINYDKLQKRWNLFEKNRQEQSL